MGKKSTEIILKYRNRLVNEALKLGINRYVIDNLQQTEVINDVIENIEFDEFNNLNLHSALVKYSKAYRQAKKSYTITKRRSPKTTIKPFNFRPCCSKYPGIWPFCKSNC